MKTKFTFADGLLLAVDLKVNNAMPGRDGLKKLTGLNEGQCRKIIDMIKGGFADYFFSDDRATLFHELWLDRVSARKRTQNKSIPEESRYRMADIHHSDIENFKFWEG